METSTAVVAAVGIAVVGLVGYGLVSSMNARSEVVIRDTTGAGSRSGSGLESGSWGDVLFGVLSGLGIGIGGIIAGSNASRDANKAPGVNKVPTNPGSAGTNTNTGNGSMADRFSRGIRGSVEV